MALIPFDDRDGQIIMDGELIPWRDARVHILSHALHYGSCVFEGERSYNGKIFKGTQHSGRLLKSAQILGIKAPIDIDALDEAKAKVMAANNITDGYLRALIWRGSGEMGVSAQNSGVRWAIACWEWPSYFSPEKRDKGIRLKTSKWRRPAPDTAPVNAKAAGLYMICTLSKHAAEDEGYDDALMLDYRGYVAEATGANLFAIKDGSIFTPIPDCFLDGITRRTVIDLAKKRGISVQETRILPSDLKDFDEIFLTGTAAEVTAVGEIDGHIYKVGDVTKTLRDDYEKLVRS